MKILAGDVGGTKIRLGIYDISGDSFIREKVERFESARYASLADAVHEFLNDQSFTPAAACFGIPGPVINGTVKVTNLPWTLSEADLSKSLGIAKVKLINDLVATAAAIPHLTDADVITLHPGPPLGSDGVAAVIAPGTGLGQAIICMQKGKAQLLASEGGHSNFAPSTSVECDLFRYLADRFEHISVEHVLCGPGLVNIYNFFKDSGLAEEPAELREEMQSQSQSAVITRYAQEQKFDICIKTLDTFVHILGAHCSNLMISVLAYGGIYLGGGVPPKILDKLKDGSIIEAYLAKGKMRAQVEKTALRVIRDDHAALTGAAFTAAAQAAEG